jgi:hypothetical protein
MNGFRCGLVHSDPLRTENKSQHYRFERKLADTNWKSRNYVVFAAMNVRRNKWQVQERITRPIMNGFRCDLVHSDPLRTENKSQHYWFEHKIADTNRKSRNYVTFAAMNVRRNKWQVQERITRPIMNGFRCGLVH